MAKAEAPTLRSIKEEIRLAIVCEWLNSGSILKGDGTYRNGSPKILEKHRGSHITHETASQAIHVIIRLACDKYIKLGFVDQAEKARRQVHRNYIKKLLAEYNITLEENYAERFKREAQEATEKKERLKKFRIQKTKKERRASILNALIVTALFIFLLFLMRSCVNGDDRTDAEKALDAYCTSMGRSGCSDTAREIRRMSNER